jgi:Uma2 family endonuclease
MNQPITFPLRALTAGFRRFSVAEYEKLVGLGIITEDDNLELLEGYLVNKMGHNPPHDGTIQLVDDAIRGVLPAGWCVRVQSVIALPDSQPEPDLAIARGDKRSYLRRHPGGPDLGPVIEVADSSLDSDRADKVRIYARAGLPTYWIVNVIDRQVEVYTDPDPAATPPGYRTRADYRPGDAVPVVLDGQPAGSIPVADLLP